MEVMIPLSVIIAALGLFIMNSLFYGSDLLFFLLFVIRLSFFIFSTCRLQLTPRSLLLLLDCD